MAVPNYIRRQRPGGPFKYIRPVPPDLQESVGQTKITRSLGTSDAAEARRRARPVEDEVERLFDEARRRKAEAEIAPVPGSIRDTLEDEGIGFYGVMNANTGKAHWMQVDVRPQLPTFYPDENIVVPAGRPFPSGVKRGVPYQPPDARPAGLTMRQAHEKWLVQNPRTSLKGKAQAQASIDDWVEIHGDEAIELITADQVDEFVDLLRRLPDRRNRSFATLGIRAAVKAADDEGIAPRLSQASLVRVVGMLAAIVEVQVPRRIQRNPFKGAIRTPRQRAAGTKSLPFSVDDLNRIFRSPLYTGARGRTLKPRQVVGREVYKDALFWLPLIALYTGARRNEIGQLRCRDVVRDGNHPYFNITNIDESTGEETGRLKNANSRRIVPLHPILTEIGIFDLIDGRKEGDLLLKELKMDANGYFGSKKGEEFNAYIRGCCGIDNARKTFKSFRSGFVSELARTGIGDDLRRELVGHTDGGRRADVHANHYLNFNIETKYRAVAGVTYPGLDLTHLLGIR